MRTNKLNVLNKAVAAATLIATGAAVHGASLVTFDALPTTPNLPEFAFTINPSTLLPNFVTGPGAVGNGMNDGLLGRDAQLAGGLGIQTPLHVLGASAKFQSNGSTAFDDVTLVISDLAANAVAFPPLPDDPGDVIIQPLGQANPLAPVPTFAMYATSPDSNPLDGQLLLTGTITKASLTALNDDDTASVLSSKVTYTGGAIYNALVAAGGVTTGSLSWSLLDIRDAMSNPSVTIDPVSNFFTSFSSNGSGLFSTPTVPEPASAAIVGIPLLAMLVQRRRTMRV